MVVIGSLGSGAAIELVAGVGLGEARVHALGRLNGTKVVLCIVKVLMKISSGILNPLVVPMRRHRVSESC